MVYRKYTGNDSRFVLPSHDADVPITAIGAKAFLSCKQIECLILPASITVIEDWAFAHMQHLKELEMPANPIHFGKQVFLDCHELQCLRLFPDCSGNPGLPSFFANVAARFPERLLANRALSDCSLLDPVWAASETEHDSWMKSYDKLLLFYLLEDDLAGYEPVFYGWVNDEDSDISQKPAHLHKHRSNKVYLTFQRLTYPMHLADADREILQAYLRDHMPWGQKASDHTAVWDLLPEHYSQEVQYCRLLEEAGALPVEHVPELVEHLASAAPEVIAWLLRYQQQNQKEFDFFDTLAL